MYREHFHLQRALFEDGIAQDAQVFRSAAHNQLAANLAVALTLRDSVAVLSGPAGVGKTTLASHTLRAMTTRLALGWLGNPPLTSHELLEMLLAEFGFSAYKLSRVERLQMWRQHLNEMRATDTCVCVLVENADAIQPDVLVALESLTSADPNGGAGANVVLTARAPLAEVLASPPLAALKQRLRMQCKLTPLTRAELGEYLAHRVMAAGGVIGKVMSDGAIEALHLYSGGVIRVVNNLCVTALTMAAAQKAHRLEAELVVHVAAEVFGIATPTIAPRTAGATPAASAPAPMPRAEASAQAVVAEASPATEESRPADKIATATSTAPPVALANTAPAKIEIAAPATLPPKTEAAPAILPPKPTSGTANEARPSSKPMAATTVAAASAPQPATTTVAAPSAPKPAMATSAPSAPQPPTATVPTPSVTKPATTTVAAPSVSKPATLTPTPAAPAASRPAIATVATAAEPKPATVTPSAVKHATPSATATTPSQPKVATVSATTTPPSPPKPASAPISAAAPARPATAVSTPTTAKPVAAAACASSPEPARPAAAMKPAPVAAAPSPTQRLRAAIAAKALGSKPATASPAANASPTPERAAPTAAPIASASTTAKAPPQPASPPTSSAVKPEPAPAPAAAKAAPPEEVDEDGVPLLTLEVDDDDSLDFDFDMTAAQIDEALRTEMSDVPVLTESVENAGDKAVDLSMRLALDEETQHKLANLEALSHAKDLEDISNSMAETLFGDAELDQLATALALASGAEAQEDEDAPKRPSKAGTA